MANKFQKSVLERLEQEAVRQKQKTKKEKSIIKAEKQPDENTEALIVTITNEPAAPEVDNQEPQEASEEKTILSQNVEQSVNNKIFAALPEISEYLRRDNQRLAKNKTFYLDSDVIEAIKTTAREQSVTDSKLVNDILRRVLGLR